MSRIPLQYLGLNGKFLPYEETPNGARESDDFQPRAQIKKEFATGNIKSSEEDKIKVFAEKYCSVEKLVKKELIHLELLK